MDSLNRLYLFFLIINLSSHICITQSLPLDLSPQKNQMKVRMVERIDDMLFMMQEGKAGQSRESYRWPKGTIPYVFGPGYSTKEMEQVREAMDYIEAFTCVRFVPKPPKTDNYIIIQREKGKCQSFVGNIRNGPQQVGLDPSSRKCGHPTFGGHVLHELIHALGFFHEHARNDRDEYIRVRYKNLENDRRTQKNFGKNSENKIKSEYFGVPYNYGSIMHYSMRAGSINGKNTIVKRRDLNAKEKPLEGKLGQRNGLSRGDIKMIHNMYRGICNAAAGGQEDFGDSGENDLEIPELEDWANSSDSESQESSSSSSEEDLDMFPLEEMSMMDVEMDEEEESTTPMGL